MTILTTISSKLYHNWEKIYNNKLNNLTTNPVIEDTRKYSSELKKKKKPEH